MEHRQKNFIEEILKYSDFKIADYFKFKKDNYDFILVKDGKEEELSWTMKKIYLLARQIETSQKDFDENLGNLIERITLRSTLALRYHRCGSMLRYQENFSQNAYKVLNDIQILGEVYSKDGKKKQSETFYHENSKDVA